MTENEAKNIIIENRPFVGSKELQEAVCMAIQALEEIQQYRAIGTVEELTALKENCIEPSSLRLYLTQLEKYRAIGTIDEFKALKEIDEDLRLKYCYEDLSSAENRGYMQGSNEAVDEFANFLHKKAKENNGLRLSSETRSCTHPCIFDYLKEFKEEQICKEED